MWELWPEALGRYPRGDLVGVEDGGGAGRVGGGVRAGHHQPPRGPPARHTAGITRTLFNQFHKVRIVLEIRDGSSEAGHVSHVASRDEGRGSR